MKTKTAAPGAPTKEPPAAVQPPSAQEFADAEKTIRSLTDGRVPGGGRPRWRNLDADEQVRLVELLKGARVGLIQEEADECEELLAVAIGRATMALWKWPKEEPEPGAPSESELAAAGKAFRDRTRAIFPGGIVIRWAALDADEQTRFITLAAAEKISDDDYAEFKELLRAAGGRAAVTAWKGTA